jgi:hypothetical protein
MRPQQVATVALTLAKLYQEGLYQEEVQGDLERAVAIYHIILSHR